MSSKLIVIFGIASALASCGTITRGTSEVVIIRAEPDDAKITTSLGHVCKSPCKVDVSRKTEFTAYAEKPGYKRGSHEIKTKASGKGAASMAGNVLIGGVIGLATDAATGAALDHYPNPATIVLEPTARPATARPKPAKKRSSGRPIS
ncbi:translation initiation factor 2 [Neorhizobium sp. T786]|uniref:translation initiation factor 2 n=1 Tax=Pseudorhizobium xiangyangii TaxID=2883104 RepID=UPI001D000E13|nr:translation initiation factor 2 [Neorhizobium xiangyangii]MCB5205373.1 translation initiation factor 2 [Neorhizobium xiangyangii]